MARYGWPELFALAYSTVLASELVGDRSIFTVSSLAMRFRPGAVACGIAAAFMAKMSVAVLCGRLLAGLPLRWASALSAATLLGTAIYLWLGRREAGPATEPSRGWAGAAGVAFSAVFFAEWADPGQISAAALTASSTSPPLLIWWAGTLALCTKGALAMTLGVGLRRRIPDRLARAVASSCCLTLGLVALSNLLRG